MLAYALSTCRPAESSAKSCILALQIDNPKAFNSRIYSLVKDALDLKGDLSVPAEPDEPQVCMVLCRFASHRGKYPICRSKPDLLTSLQDEADEEPEASDGEAEEDAIEDDPISEGRDEL